MYDSIFSTTGLFYMLSGLCWCSVMSRKGASWVLLNPFLKEKKNMDLKASLIIVLCFLFSSKQFTANNLHWHFPQSIFMKVKDTPHSLHTHFPGATEVREIFQKAENFHQLSFLALQDVTLFSPAVPPEPHFSVSLFHGLFRLLFTLSLSLKL